MPGVFDVVVVGAGITGATAAAVLRQNYRVAVVDCRHHIGGLCYDVESRGGYVHAYGPHIFHTSDAEVVEFLSAFTTWRKYTHRVTAEINDGNIIKHVPFPYSEETAAAIGRDLSDAEIINLFFKAYTEKMWGKPWASLPEEIRKRVPARAKTSAYFCDEFVAMPAEGYTRMITRMLRGVDVMIGAGANDWLDFIAPGTHVIYTGRVDLIPGVIKLGTGLPYVDTDFSLGFESWRAKSPVVNYCHAGVACTRKTCFSMLTGGDTHVVCTERPRQVAADNLCLGMHVTGPTYPVPNSETSAYHAAICDKARALYPGIHFLGRLGSYRYLDMWSAVKSTLDYCRGHFLATVVSRQPTFS